MCGERNTVWLIKSQRGRQTERDRKDAQGNKVRTAESEMT